MWKKLPLPYSFLLYFIILAGILLIFWNAIDVVYLYLLVLVAQPIWSVFQYPVQLVIQNNILHFVYGELAGESLSFNLPDADEIYLNLILLIAFFGSTGLTTQKMCIRQFIYSLLILFTIHEFILFAYSYTHIWEYIGTQNVAVQEKLVPLISQKFSKVTADFLSIILYHWNTWGWDVVPLVLWIGGIYKTVFIKELWGK
ncbi:MAG: hypothetical protein M1426_01945 [Patescibacteria group bacterium]|nr:hypothetical protein [Patescibacteria group bacterium]